MTEEELKSQIKRIDYISRSMSLVIKSMMAPISYDKTEGRPVNPDPWEDTGEFQGFKRGE
tara:strand:+ start:54 stop:233 length:180 start_codon:yes stop_codon:yes gene_type:complete